VNSRFWRRWQERRIQWVAALPSLIHRSTVPRWLSKLTTAQFVPENVVTDEAPAREEFPQVVLDLGDHPPRFVPGAALILEADP
jgi:hypothetical protein